MDKNLNFVNEKKIERTIKALEKKNMHGYLVKDQKELIQKIEELVKPGATVGIGGSMTLFETGLIDYLRTDRYNLLDRYKEGLTGADLKNIFRQSLLADAYFASTNAITENGELYNVDGNGNRVAAMLYGPDKVILVVGVNKIVKDEEEAINRVKNIAAPANTKRLSPKTPCEITGECIDCSSEGRICCEYTTIKMQRAKGRIHVIFLNEEYGY
ncbi:MAG: lactate utilization protein [Clostridioides difficile]|nr:lactate utilization protein [Clostridioides difficile]